MTRDRLNVLLIEDNPADVHLIARMLAEVQEQEIDLHSVERLSKGLDYFDNNPVDVILLDLSLPDSHGLDTFLRAKNHENVDVPIVVLSGLVDEDLALEAVQAGAQDYLVKGKIGSDTLQRALRYAIERAQLLVKEREARVRAERTQQRLSLLAEASTLLGSSLDYETTLQSVARLFVPQLADYCAMDLLMEDGSLQRLTTAYTNPEMQALEDTIRRLPGDDEGGNLLTQVLRSGQIRRVHNLATDFTKSALADDQPNENSLQKSPPLSLLVVPLIARNLTFGTLTLATTRAEGSDEEGSATLAWEVAQRAALAIDNARLYREAQSALQRSDEALTLLNTLLQTAPTGFAFLDPDLKFVRVNAALAKMNGISIEEHIGRKVSELLPDLSSSIEPRLREVLQTGNPVLNLEVAHDDPARPGHKRYRTVSYYPVHSREKQIQGIGAVIHDITERKRYEKRLRFVAEAGRAFAKSLDQKTTLQSVARLAVPLFADWCVIYIVRDDGTVIPSEIVHANPERQALACEMFRRYPPVVQDPHSPMATVLRTGEPLLIEEFTAAHLQKIAKNGQHLEMLQKIAPVSGIVVPLVARGRTLGALAFATSESARRYDENDLSTVSEVAARAALSLDNARLYQQAQEAIHLRDEFLATVSHDLSSPLTSIKGQAQLLLRKATGEEEGSANQLVDGLKKIDDRVSHMVAMLNELLDVARIQGGQTLELNCRPTDLVTLVKKLVDELQHSIEQHEVQLDASMPELIGPWDQARLERVVDNLLSNAVKYSPEGGKITARITTDGSWGVLSIEDQGIGIPPADLPHIFERFHRGSNVSELTPGTGLGLSGVLRIVRAHGGQLEVDSEENVGTTFTVRLPTKLPTNNGPSTSSGEPITVRPSSTS